MALLASVAPQAGAKPPSNAQGPVADEFGVGFFYGTFNEDPNIALFAGGSIEEFCAAGPDGDPSSAPSRVFNRKDGSVEIKVNQKNVPIYLYFVDSPNIPALLSSICPGIVGGAEAPTAFAAGSAHLKVRLTIESPNRLEMFNGVKGTAVSPDGTTYRVMGAADFVVENGMPTEDPADFVKFSLKQIRRGR